MKSTSTQEIQKAPVPPIGVVEVIEEKLRERGMDAQISWSMIFPTPDAETPKVISFGRFF